MVYEVVGTETQEISEEFVKIIVDNHCTGKLKNAPSTTNTWDDLETGDETR
jgi:hypothetical protein